MKKILLQLDTEEHPSPFDAIVAQDAGVDVLLSHGNVKAESARALAQDAFFTRGPDDLKNTAVWVGGKDVAAGEQIFDEVQKAFFGPFREAVDSSLQGDRRTYQQDPANAREGVREALLDVGEGADVVMVKPALAYLDVLRAVREAVDVPVAAYNISGEYTMVEAAAAQGWIAREPAILETLTSIHRAGADVILTYWATEAARLLR